MSTEQTKTGGAVERSSRWSEAEKLALLISVINSTGAKPTWSNVPVPAGRTTGTCQKQFAELVKQSAGITMVGGNEITPAAKRTTKPAALDSEGNPITAPTKKRTRKAAELDDDGKPIKKARAPRKPKSAALLPTPESAAGDEDGSKDVKVKAEQQDDEDEEGDLEVDMEDGSNEQALNACEAGVAA